MYRYISRKSCSQFDSLPLTSLTISFQVTERVFTMGDIADAIDEGRMLEAFGTGTAAVLSPIASVHFEVRSLDELHSFGCSILHSFLAHNSVVYSLLLQGRDLTIPLNAADPDALAGPVAQRMWDEITAIQYGKQDSDWSVVVE